MDQQIQVRTIKTNGNVYIRSEDVVFMLQELAATEATDVKNRINELAHNIMKIGRGE